MAFWKTVFKTVSNSGAIVSRSAWLHMWSILKVTAASSAQASEFGFHRGIMGIKLLHLIFQSKCLYNKSQNNKIVTTMNSMTVSMQHYYNVTHDTK
jgi:hypothetical protein